MKKNTYMKPSFSLFQAVMALSLSPYAFGMGPTPVVGLICENQAFVSVDESLDERSSNPYIWVQTPGDDKPKYIPVEVQRYGGNLRALVFQDSHPYCTSSLMEIAKGNWNLVRYCEGVKSEVNCQVLQ